MAASLVSPSCDHVAASFPQLRDCGMPRRDPRLVILAIVRIEIVLISDLSNGDKVGAKPGAIYAAHCTVALV
jgi:hypothetical protein